VKARGTGSVFRRVYRDKKTGTLKETDTWWVRYADRPILVDRNIVE
jgi:hypothetical protein